MKKQAALIAIAFGVVASAIALNEDFQSQIVTTANSPLTIIVPDQSYLRIHSFTQNGGGSQRGFVTSVAGTPSPSPTATIFPTATPIPTGTPTPTPTATPTPTVTPTPTATPVPIPGVVLTATIIGSSTSTAPEFIKDVTISGPSTVTVTRGDTDCFITYRKRPEATPTPSE